MPEPAAPPSISDWIARTFFFVLLAVFCFSMPHPAGIDLDPSWRMALSFFFREGLQFGRDVVFTYGPLGFLMGNTHDGSNFMVLFAWQALQGLLLAAIVFRQGMQLPGYSRYFYFVFFFLLGINYHDVTQQMAMAIVAFEQLREREPATARRSILAGVLLALFSLVKFTNLILAVVFVIAIAGLRLWRRQSRGAALMAGAFFGAFILGWILCRQNPLNLPAYLRNSWEISQGYQEAMGVAAPPQALWKGLTALGLIIAYAGLHFITATDRAQSLAVIVALGGFTYLNWKHGFIRADGHMVGFFYAALFIATAFPALLADSVRWRVVKRVVLVAAAFLALSGIGDALPGFLRGIAGYNQDRVGYTIPGLMNPPDRARQYDDVFQRQQVAHALPKTRAVVGQASIDVFGHEQAVAIINGFNFRPRPVFQGYSAYRPHLARLNFEHYASDRAPDFVLVKFHTIDHRHVALDDSELLRLLPHRYRFVHLEKGYMLWQRKPGAFDPASIAPQPVATGEFRLGEMWSVGDAAREPLWATIDVRLNLLGKLRSFFYKPPQLMLHLEDDKGNKSDYRFTMPQGRTGFILSPIVEDMISFMRYASPEPERIIRAVGVSVAKQDADCFAPNARVTLHRIPRSDAGAGFLRANAKDFFSTFKATPVSFKAQTPLSTEPLDGEIVTVFHAPSELLVNVPANVAEFAGNFGYLPGAYTGGKTDGAIFTVTLVAEGKETPLFERALNPVHRSEDRGLQRFKIQLPPGAAGQLRLSISPGKTGDYSWDWTAWGGLEFR